MAKTSNRAPIEFSVPDRVVKNHFLDLHNWKGMIDDKNFLNVEAESFQDCNNIYVDSENVLRSRPSLKKQKILINDNELTDITNIYTFNDTIVYETTNNTNPITYNLTFVTEGKIPVTQTSITEYKLLLAERKIFVFTKTSLNYYDMDLNNYLSGTNFIYVPTTKVIVNGVDTDTDAESPNELTTDSFTKYIYDNFDIILPEEILNKQVTLKINNQEYQITFDDFNKPIVVQKYGNISFADKSSIPKWVNGYYKDNIAYNMIEYSEDSNCIICEKASITTIDGNGTPYMTYNIYYSVDNIIFDLIDTIDGCTSIPHITRDELYCIVFKQDGPYIRSLVYTDVNGQLGYKYPSFTNLLKLQSNYTAADYTIDIFAHIGISGYTGDQNLSTFVNGDFIDDGNFAFVYQDSSDVADTYTNSFPTNTNGFPAYNAFYLITCIGGVLRKNKITQKAYPTIPLVKFVEIYNYIIVYYYEATENTFNFSNCKDSYIIAHLNNNNVYNVTTGVNHIVNNSHYYLCNSRLPIMASIQYDIGEDKICIYDLFGNNNDYTNITTIYLIISQIDNNDDVVWNTLTNTLNIVNILTSIKVNDDFSKLQTYDKYLSLINKITSRQYDKLILGIPVDILNDYLYYYSIKTYLIDGKTYFDNTVLENIYSSNITKPLEIIVREGNNGYTFNKLFNHYSQLYNYYITVGKTLYISSYNYNDVNNFKWYFPKINTEEYDYNITNIHPISRTEMAVFFEHNISICSRDDENNVYRYYNSKIQVGCREGNDVITTFDGKYVIFSCERGIVALTYQDFINTDEQALTYFSDNIYTHYHLYQTTNNIGIKLYKYNYWIVVYKENSNVLYLFDLRTSSWWPWSLPYNCKKFVTIDYKPVILSNGSITNFDLGMTDYRDYYENEFDIGTIIDWNCLSQILYLGSMNNYKRIVNMTIISTHDVESLKALLENSSVNESTTYHLDTMAYRKAITRGLTDNTKREISSHTPTYLRTQVIRFSSFKVDEFQFKMYNDEVAYVQIPLQIGDITVKYRIGNEVR